MLDGKFDYVIVAKAILAYHDKQALPDGAIVEITTWQESAAVPGSTHALKCRLFYGADGQRLVGYDNERGKSDHRY